MPPCVSIIPPPRAKINCFVQSADSIRQIVRTARGNRSNSAAACYLLRLSRAGYSLFGAPARFVCACGFPFRAPPPPRVVIPAAPPCVLPPVRGCPLRRPLSPSGPLPRGRFGLPCRPFFLVRIGGTVYEGLLFVMSIHTKPHAFLIFLRATCTERDTADTSISKIAATSRCVIPSKQHSTNS